MTADGLGVCTAERACVARFRSGADGICAWHADEFDPWHRMQIDAARMRLGERMHLVVPEAAILAAREDDDETVAAIA